ncbi:hypothetical protein GNY06_02950 [Elizabethkingia argentiflava]|uniref:Uncharacterized protein n=1 Tax=Elizabethkingia argenteiflava TaxID=2681556 RepID=A0A845PTM9_9FLAO|nr:hypothetical protein [Elizabethkingia argenteiflava]NAW50391.1 hypothetical protein [Elizabethkingia argenteiflava]
MSLTLKEYEKHRDEFIEGCEKVDQGELSFLDFAVSLSEEIKHLSALQDIYKAWLNENVDNITNESEQYGKEGYKGFVFSKATKTTYSYKHIPTWIDLEKKRKELENMAKLALKMVEKRGVSVDENGEIIPLPEVNITSFIKTETVRR